MATVTVIRVVENWPESFNGSFKTQVDIEYESKYMRFGYSASDIASADDVKAKIEAEAVVIKDPEKKARYDNDIGEPSGGTLRPDWIPTPFDI